MLPSTQIKRDITFHLFCFFKGLQLSGKPESAAWAHISLTLTAFKWHYVRSPQTTWHWQGPKCCAVRFVSEVCMPCACRNHFLFRVGRPQSWRRDASGVGGGAHAFPQLSSSGCACSNSRTWVKGKWPRLPLHSPSHWPFTLILVTFTMSPTCLTTTNSKGFSVQCVSTESFHAQCLTAGRWISGRRWPVLPWCHGGLRKTWDEVWQWPSGVNITGKYLWSDAEHKHINHNRW